MSNSPHVTALERQARLKRMAAEKFRVVDGKVEKYTVDFSAQDAEAVVAAAEKHERMLNPVIGERDERGVFLGVWEPKDRDGNSLKKKFNVFAAPQDLPYTMNYVNTAKYVAKLDGWHGFDGANYATDQEIYAALKDDSYNGGWFIPTRELLAGAGPYGGIGVRKGKIIQSDNLFDHQNKGAFKGTFKTAKSGGSDFPNLYWSSTQYLGVPVRVWTVKFPDRYEVENYKDKPCLSCRPVRLELKP